MRVLLDEYRELVALAELHILQEYSESGYVILERSSLDFFPVPVASPPSLLRKTPTPSPVPQRVVERNFSDKLSSPHTTQPSPIIQKEDIQKESLAQKGELLPKIQEAVLKPTQAPIAAVESPKQPLTILGTEKPKFLLDPLHKRVDLDFKELRKCVASLFPNLSLLDDPPHLEKKDIGDLFLSHPSEILIVFAEESREARNFFKSIAHALSWYLGSKTVTLIPASILAKKEIPWNLLAQSSLKLVLGHPQKAFSPLHWESLQETLKQNSTLSFIPIADSFYYFKHPEQKAELWKSIRKMLLHP
jgi:hypothetical protein